MRYIILLILFLRASSGSATAYTPMEGTISLGAMVGTMGAVSGQYWFTDQASVSLGAEFLDHPWTVFYADFIWHFPTVFGKGTRFGREVRPYAGGGVGGGFWDRTDTCGRWNCNWNSNTTGSGNGFFLHAVAGVEWYPTGTRFSVFAELDPTYLWYPSAVVRSDLAIGGRYNF